MKRFLVIFLAFLSLSHVSVAQDKLYHLFQLVQGAGKMYEAYTITDEDLAAYAHKVIEQQDAANYVCAPSSSYAKRLKKITSGLKEMNGTPLNFKVYKDSKTANAFACPDGSIRVYSKLMDIMTDEEVLGVVAHELGHVACHHSRKEYQVSLVTSALRGGLTLSDGVVGSIAASSAGALIEYLANAKYSRKQESEADKFGYYYLKEHGKNPHALASALNRLLEIEDGPDNEYVVMLSNLISSHPDLSYRIKALESLE